MSKKVLGFLWVPTTSKERLPLALLAVSLIGTAVSAILAVDSGPVWMTGAVTAAAILGTLPEYKVGRRPFVLYSVFVFIGVLSLVIAGLFILFPDPVTGETDTAGRWLGPVFAAALACLVWYLKLKMDRDDDDDIDKSTVDSGTLR